jgi:hypothetical protein
MKRTGVPEGVDGNADLHAQAAARTPDHLIFPPFGADGTLVCPHNGGIDDQVFEIRIFAQLCENSFQTPFFAHRRNDKISEACCVIATADFLATAA